MKLQLCSLLANEEEWLLKNYDQHAGWPGLARWAFVHGVDVAYGAASPHMATADGLSTDRTGELLDDLARRDPRVTVIHHGWMRHHDAAQGKCAGRNRYLDVAEWVKPDYLWVVDLDEFLARSEQLAANAALCRYGGVALQQRHVWAPPGSGLAPFAREVVGGYWDVPHPRGWRWRRGMRYTTNHNLPAGVRCEVLSRGQAPACVHLGFASSLESRQAKARYYVARGEGRLDRRGPYVESRRCWEVWREGDPLPFGARLVPWDESLTPEVFREGVPR